MTSGEFFSWWGRQLADLVPGSWYRLWHRARTTVTLRIDTDQITLIDPSGQVAAQAPLGSAGEPVPPEAAQAFSAGLPSKPQRLRVVLAPGQFLVHHLTLPAAARDHLAEAVRYQLPKLLPLPADQVLYACGSEPRTTDEGRLQVWLVAIPRRRLTGPLALIGQEAPHEPLALSAPPPAGQPLEVAWPISESARAPHRLMRFAWLGMLILWLGALGLHLHNRHHTLESLEQQLAELRGEAAAVGQMREDMADATQQLDWLAERKRSAASALLMLDSLSQLLDDQTWLQRLDFDGSEVNLTGVSSEPSSLVETLENSDSFEAVRFGAFTRDSRNDANRFNLSAKVEKPPSAGDS